MRVISLYTGAGGLDLGLEAAGFDTRVAIEVDADCVATIAANREWPVIARDIHEVSSKEILRVAGLREGDADLLVGGPPCQPFSKSAYWATGKTQRLDDPRASTLEQFLRVLRDTQPKAFLLENVPGLGYKQKDEGLSLLRQVFEAINGETGSAYSMGVKVLNAVDFGVPQDRKRLFIIGQRDGREFTFPSPTHFEEPDDQPLLHREFFLTAWDAIGDLNEDGDANELRVTGKWAELLPSIPEGQNYLFHTNRGDGESLFGWRRRFWNFLLKLAKDRPSWTITAQPGPATGPFHWKNRRLSAKELARLQTFPEGYEIAGNLRAAQKQLGNAVPAALAERLGLAIRADLLLDKSVSTNMPLTLLPERRRPIPPSEEPCPVPAKYLHRRGKHSAHPGTGKGFRAKAWAESSA